MIPIVPDRRSEARPILFRVFFFAAFGFLLYQLLRIVAPFLSGILLAITLALVFYPLHTRFLRWSRGRPNLAAGTSVATLFLIVVVPTLFFLALLGRQAAAIYPWAQEQVQEVRTNPRATLEERLPAPVKKVWRRSQELLIQAGVNPRDTLLRTMEGIGNKVSSLGASIVKNLILFVFQTLIMVFTLFFIFRDGNRLTEKIVGLIPMETAYKTHILNRLNQTLTAVVRGMFVTASVQGLLAGVGFALAGVSFSVVLGFATAFMALIPFIGATAVWLPVGVYLILKGWVVQGVGILLWGGLVVSTVDNFLRPFIIGSKAKIPIALLFFGTLGGLQAYGPIGLLVGPLTVASVLAFAKIYGEQLARATEKKEISSISGSTAAPPLP
ncbi:MAG: AI-2E family transporter [Elusimicrobia bacterium]|nr:AI-2E family transporter [Elusimicrobiota bacterium]